MVFNGALKDKILSELFIQIEKDKKSGKLILQGDKTEGEIIFHKGIIVFAHEEDENIMDLFSGYLLTKNIPPTEVQELRVLSDNKLNDFIDRLYQRGYLSINEFKTLSHHYFEDTLHKLYELTKGSYKFDFVRDISVYMKPDFKLSATAFCESAREVLTTEKHIHSLFHGQTVFIKTNHGDNDLPIYPLSMPNEYILSQIDGTKTVDVLHHDNFFTKRRLYSILFNLFNDKRIIPLPDKISQSVSDALKRSEDVQKKEILKIFASALIFVALVFSIGYLGINTQKLFQVPSIVIQQRKAPSINRAKHKLKTYSSYYRIKSFKEYSTYEELITNKFLRIDDLKDLPFNE